MIVADNPTLACPSPVAPVGYEVGFAIALPVTEYVPALTWPTLYVKVAVTVTRPPAGTVTQALSSPGESVSVNGPMVVGRLTSISSV